MTQTSPFLSKLGKFLRRMAYALLILLLIWAVLVQAGCFSMRTSDAGWVKKLQEKNQQLSPGFLDVRDKTGRRIHAVYVSAADSLPLVVLVHGSPGASDAFVDYLADSNLTQKARLVAIDRPGFGYTEHFGKPEGSLEAQAAAVYAVVEHLAPGQKVLLLGHSMGGPVIARFGMDYPDRTAGLIFVAGSIDPAQEEHPWWQTAVDNPPLEWLTPKPLWTSNAEIIPLEKELEMMMPYWPKITCPVQVIHAVNDQLVPIANADFAQKVLVHCTDLKLEILPDGDHFILWSRQPVVKKAMLEMLAKR